MWVNADNCEDWCGPIPPTYEEWEAQGWEEHGTSIVNHCLYFELGRLEEVASLASPRYSTCPLQGKRRTQTQPADWLALVENGRY